MLGVDLREAFERYLAFGETTSDRRHIEARRRDLTAQLVEAGRRLDATLAEDAKITRYVDLLCLDRPSARVAALPSLDEWAAAEGIDPDEWSEAELLEDYRAAHGLDSLVAPESPPREGSDTTNRRIQALNHLSRLLSVEPQAADPVDAWFAPPVVRHLRQVGVMTLQNLFQLVNVHGHRWHGQVPRIGARRATQVVGWLRSQAESLKLTLRDGLDEPETRRALRIGIGKGDLVEPPRFGMLPLERLALPSPLQGSDGIFRSRLPNTLEAQDDLQAIRRWLARYEERPATMRSYRKEIERFLLWSVGVRRKPVSSTSSIDCQAYRAFLQAVPANWIYPHAVERSDPRWRPFRGTPSPASQKQALVILQTMFEGLRDAGYLVANPMRAVMKGFALPASRIQTQRSFGEREWAHLLHCLGEEPPGPARTRLRCLLELLVASGIRLDELARARRDHLRLETLPDLPPAWVLTITGKRNKVREVPLADEVVALLDRHAVEAAPAAGDRTAMPLVFALNGSVAQWVSRNGRITLARQVEGGGGALSAAGIHAVLKRFFARAGESASQAGLDPLRFTAASTHWMRHTFVRQALVDGAPLEIVGELAGHASLDTTSIYASQELARKISTVQKLRPRRSTEPDKGTVA